MKKIILSTIIITALITFWVTKEMVNSHQNNYSIQEHESHSGHGDHEDHKENITEKVLFEFGAEVDIASSGILNKTIELPGEIQLDPDRLVHITPRFGGLVKEVYKQIGDKVNEGDLLAIIESNESLTVYELKSSINGIIIDMHFTKGETAQNSDNFFAIANLSKVWLNLSVYQKYLTQLKIGQTVNVLIKKDFPSISGEISYISPTIDEHTRTAIARVVLSNSYGWLRPGQFITGFVTISQSSCSIMIPKTAIETIKGLDVVFTKNEHGYEPINIKIGQQNSEFVEILSGLKIGQQYVKKGGFILKAQMAKSSFGGGHNH